MYMCVYIYIYLYVFVYECIYWMSLSEPHTSRRNGMSATFTKSVKVRINGMSVCIHTSLHKNEVIPYKCFRVCVHHVNNYQSSLRTPFKAGTCVQHMKNY